jgi:hypothetical protein
MLSICYACGKLPPRDACVDFAKSQIAACSSEYLSPSLGLTDPTINRASHLLTPVFKG